MERRGRRGDTYGNRNKKAAKVLPHHLGIPPGNHLEALQGDRKGQHSIRINEQYRIRFQWATDGALSDLLYHQQAWRNCSPRLWAITGQASRTKQESLDLQP